MAGEFIPFLSAVKPALSGAGNTAQFRPIATALPASSGNTAFLAAKQVMANPGHAHGEVSIDVRRDGERISQIRIQCRCGEVIELDCEY
jgi:hypothetical protein